MVHRLSLTLAALSFALPVTMRAGDVTAYRGPQNNGVYDETGLMKVWPPDGPKLLWKQMLGQAYGPPSVVDGMVWIASDGGGHLFGFTLDGELKHKHPFGSTSWARFTGPRCTPLIRDGISVIVRPNADVHAIDLKTGEQRWSLNAWKSFGAGTGKMGWGFPSSFPAFENKIILNTCSRTNATPPIVAVDFATGKTVWEADAGSTTDKKYSAGDHAASVFQHNGRWLNVNPTWRYILCLDPRDGKRLWEIPDPDVAKGSEKSLTPVYNNGYLLFDMAGAAVCVKLNKDGTGYTPLWARPHGGFAHAVILGNRAYLAGDVTQPVWRGPTALTDFTNRPPQIARVRRAKGEPPLPGAPGGLVSVDLETGETVDVIRMDEGLGHVVAADGMVYALDYDRNPVGTNMTLKAYLIQPTADGMEVAGKFRLPLAPEDAKVRDMEWQANIPPVIAQGRLFIRYGPLWAFDLRPVNNAKPAPAPAPATALWDLRLRGFFDGNTDLFLTLDVRDGTLFAGAAIANRTQHAVTAKELKFTPDGLTGTVMLGLPSTNKIPLTCEISLDARHARGSLTGTYTGAKGNQLSGHVTAR